MIAFSTAVRNAIVNKPTDFFHCIKITDNNNTVWKALTTHSNNITVGTTAYTSGSIIKVDNPQISTSVDREQFKFALADPTFADAARVESSLIGYRVEARLCFLDYSTKQPLTSLTDTILMYAGKIEGTAYIIRTEEKGESLLQISCSSPMGDLDLKRAIYLSKEFIRSRNPDDSSCDTIYGGSGVLQLKWGRK